MPKSFMSMCKHGDTERERGGLCLPCKTRLRPNKGHGEAHQLENRVRQGLFFQLLFDVAALSQAGMVLHPHTP